MDLRGKRIVVTGGAGFLGRHVVEQLRREGCKHVCVPRSTEFDLTREADIVRLFAWQKPQVVIHLAGAAGGIGANREHPGTFFCRNLLLGAQLMEQSRRFGVEKFLGAGTACSYPKFAPVPFKEQELWSGYPDEASAPFGQAKKMLLVQSAAYREQHGFNAVNLLLANLYGPHDNFELETAHVIPALIHKCVEARERGDGALTAWGTGLPTRDFLYVEDAARAVYRAAVLLETSEPVNIGSGTEVRIRELVETIADKTGFQGSISFDATKPDGQPRRCLDVTRARHWLGWQAETPLSEGLDRTISWYLARHESTARALALA